MEMEAPMTFDPCGGMEGSQTELFSMELRTCVFTETGMKIQITKVNNVVSFSCICWKCGIGFSTQSSIRLHMQTHLHPIDLSTTSPTSVDAQPAEKVKAEMITGNEIGGTDKIELIGETYNVENSYLGVDDIGANIVVTQDDVVDNEKEHEDLGDKSSEELTEDSNNGNDVNRDHWVPVVDDRRVSDTEGLIVSGSGTNADSAGNKDNTIVTLKASIPEYCETVKHSFPEVSHGGFPNKSEDSPARNHKTHCVKIQQTRFGPKSRSREEALEQKEQMPLTNETDEKPYACAVCGLRYRRKHSLGVHSRRHTGNLHTCEECGKQFPKPSALRLHSTIHTGEKPYPCTICGKMFRLQSQVDEHMQHVHEAQKPHLCDICGKSFARVSHLKRHQMIHSGKKPHLCTICGEQFSQISHLKEHAYTHGSAPPGDETYTDMNWNVGSLIDKLADVTSDT